MHLPSFPANLIGWVYEEKLMKKRSRRSRRTCVLATQSDCSNLEERIAMPTPFKYKSAQMIALIRDTSLGSALARRARLERLGGARPPCDPNAGPQSGIRGCPHVGAMTTPELREERWEILEACKLGIQPRLTPTGRVAKKQPVVVALDIIWFIRTMEIREELLKRGENPDAA